MTKKDYIMIARVIKESEVKWMGLNKSMINKGNLINNLSKELKKDNINFNYDRFDSACND